MLLLDKENSVSFTRGLVLQAVDEKLKSFPPQSPETHGITTRKIGPQIVRCFTKKKSVVQLDVRSSADPALLLRADVPVNVNDVAVRFDCLVHLFDHVREAVVFVG